VPAPTQQLGFQTRDLGNDHINPGTQGVYRFCPPTSGPHNNLQNVGPIRRNFYEPATAQRPGGFVHNLEHGYVVMLYRCGQGGCPSADELAAMRRVYEQTPIANRCNTPNKILVARFDDMTTRFAYLVWDRALLTDTFDEAQARTFAEQWQDKTGPEAPASCDR
jgi:hypothetical protein